MCGSHLALKEYKLTSNDAWKKFPVKEWLISEARQKAVGVFLKAKNLYIIVLSYVQTMFNENWAFLAYDCAFFRTRFQVYIE